MLGKFKRFFGTLLITSLPVLCFTGLLSSTVAWYSYQTRAGASYHGTSIRTNKQLQVGLITDLDFSEYDLTTENGIAWAEPGAGLGNAQINRYLELNGYATTILELCSSGQYTQGDSLSLFKSPNPEYVGNEIPATKNMYCCLPLAFRVIDTTTLEYVPNQDIWVTASLVKEINYHSERGIRIHFDDDGTEKFIFKPTSTENGQTKVSGLMDLNNDGVYDYEGNKEVIYGDYSGEPLYETFTGSSQEVDDVNECASYVGDSEKSTFISGHKNGIQKVTNMPVLATKVAEYYGKNEIFPTSNSRGILEGGKYICKTDATTFIGHTDMTIWLEGWDYVTTDRIVTLEYSLSLTFQINRV